MDKLGPIARTAEDCALVLGAIHGADGHDPAAVDRPFVWPAPRPLRELRMGYIEGDPAFDARPELVALRELGVQLAPFRLPTGLPIDSLQVIVDIEAATVFDELTRRGVRDGVGHWATTFRKAQFVPAVEYLRAQRVRTLVMQAMQRALAGFDAYLGGDDLTLTNMTGHPCVVLPTGQQPDSPHRQPDTLTITGRLFGEEDLLTLAQAFQTTTNAHRRRPPLEALLQDAAKATPS
jgi:Asp-tRNA(Asn)/Glu-tRNA(Gln) amidotransferase A subunit family amidase